MPSPTETALLTLLPTVSFLPPDLVSLAGSVLAQSRSKAASLKPEEEIGRVYACAHIAAERLKKRLDLELDKPRPPCPPKVYKKLYTYLDGALSTPVPRTPKNERKRDALGSDTPKSHAAVATQCGSRVKALEESPSRLKMPTTNAAKRGQDADDELTKNAQNIDGVPSFVMPLVRQVCKATKYPKAVPHVLVGSAAVVREIASREAKRRTDTEPAAKRRRRTPQSAKRADVQVESVEDAVALEKWPALVLALLLFTMARMRGSEPEDEDVIRLRQRASEAVEEYVIGHAGTLPKELGKITTQSLEKPVDFYMLETEDCGWLDMEWYRNIPEKVEEEPDEEDAEMQEEDEHATPRKRPSKTPLRRKEKRGGKIALAARDSLDDDLGAAGLLPGLGTMFQPSIDWLSDERMADYASWKQGILKQCAAIETAA